MDQCLADSLKKCVKKMKKIAVSLYLSGTKEMSAIVASHSPRQRDCLYCNSCSRCHNVSDILYLCWHYPVRLEDHSLREGSSSHNSNFPKSLPNCWPEVGSNWHLLASRSQLLCLIHLLSLNCLLPRLQHRTMYAVQEHLHRSRVC